MDLSTMYAVVWMGREVSLFWTVKEARAEALRQFGPIANTLTLNAETDEYTEPTGHLSIIRKSF